jgi:MFS family permease
MTLTRDGWLLVGAAALRNLAYGALSVVLALHLAEIGFGAPAIGALFTAALAGGAALTVAFSLVADRLGRRRALLANAALMTLGGAAFAASEDPLVLGVAAVVGGISPSGKDVGPFLAIEQAALPDTTTGRQRTAAFAVYNLVGSLAAALGALASGLPAALGLGARAGYQGLLVGYTVVGIVLCGVFLAVSPAVEAARAGKRPAGWLGVRRSRAVISKLAGLFALDAFAGGFVVQSLVAYWFARRYGVETSTLAGIFFAANLLSAASFLAAAPIARRIGLLNTMVFTHLPSNVLLMLVPLMPTLESAVGAFLARQLLSQLDVPTRQSYTVAVVDPDERAAAAGLTSVARTAAAAAAPAFAGLALANPTLGLPFLVAGALKIVYDLSLLAVFRHVRPPEERHG